VITLASNDTLVSSYMLLNKLLGRSPEEFWSFLGDVDTYGEPHEVNPQAPPTALVLLQVRSVAYPLTPPWLNANRARLLNDYMNLNLDTATRDFPSLLLCLRSTTMLPEIAARTRPVADVDSVHCSRLSKYSFVGLDNCNLKFRDPTTSPPPRLRWISSSAIAAAHNFMLVCCLYLME